MDRKARNGALAVLCAACVVLLMRIPALTVNDIALFASRVALTMLMCIACRAPGWFWAVAQAVGLSLLAWLIDLSEGAMAFVYGASGLMMAWTYLRTQNTPAIPAALITALSAALTTALGMALVLAFGREKLSPGSALIYALQRQIAPAIAYLLGVWLMRRPPKASAA